MVALRRENLLQGAGSGDAAGSEQDDFGGQLPDFRELMRDVDDAHLESEEARQDVVRGGVVEGGERLIEQ